ncbi:DUF871 domain-containing protein [Alkalicoccobacillus porphyridii]|uniref:DUF871 domain-containing protein n=1 Tax=Alkalicoccobacillus porphyridii TaxID=2597270 RepID=A0A553ZW56_9BACI|nr:MupG family TIM beta-alpha barrel fold protein [Alkalicoccobacillus porphyridii]TSB45708.1 DUF871 domain-containing protein [Alkalicoccobacillus porphyridii]
MRAGISIYLADPISDQLNYLNQAKDHGFTAIFTSLHIPEEDSSLYSERLKELAAYASKNGFELIIDVSPTSMEQLQLTWDHAGLLKDWGVTGLRLDYGMTIDQIVKLSKTLQIILNASTLTCEDAAQLKHSGLDPSNLEVWHNFYPRPETGLCRKDFQQTNKWLASQGFSVMAFIPGDEKRGPLYEGLPTLEEHRGVSPFAAFLDLKDNESLSTIVVGDIGLSDWSFNQFKSYLESETILLRAKAFTETDSILSTHTNRPDSARDVLRSQYSRSFEHKRKTDISPSNTEPRPLGSITIDNRLYGRYQGEIQVTKRDLSADKKVNVVGQVIEEDQPLIKHINGGMNWTFEWI